MKRYRRGFNEGKLRDQIFRRFGPIGFVVRVNIIAECPAGPHQKPPPGHYAQSGAYGLRLV